MKVELSKDDIKIRKADTSGRVSIGARKYAGKMVEVAVLDIVESEEQEDNVG